MSKFFQALERAERERALRGQITREKPPGVSSEPGPLFPPPPANAPRRIHPPRPQISALSPRDEDLSTAQVDPHLVSLLGTITPAAEQYRRICYLIEELHRSANLSVMAVSSPAVGDGKTTTAINLAGTLAQTPETSVLLVDLDLRRPSVAGALGLSHPDGPGLVDAVTNGNASLDQVLRRYPRFNLTVLPAGCAPTAPHQVLKSPRLGEIIAEMRQRYEYVVIDTPPLTSFPDCQLLTRWLDGFVMVVAAHRTPRELVEEAIPLIEPAKMVGIILTQDDRPTFGYSSYDHYYGSPSRKNPAGRFGRIGAKVRKAFRR